jgi:hypothetical protein
MLQLLGEEAIAEERLQEYFEDLYKVVCVGERLPSGTSGGGPVRSTYIVDWEQLVHLLEEYTVFCEDIVEVARLSADEAHLWRRGTLGVNRLAQA